MMRAFAFPRGSLAVAALLACAAACASAADPTVGACTRKDEFLSRFSKIDPLVAQLSAARPEAKCSLAQGIASRHGTTDIECLIRYRAPDMRLVFLSLLRAKKWCIQTRALYGLKMTGDASVVPEVAKALEDREPMVREMAANALGGIGDASALGHLKGRLDKEKDPFVLASIEAAVRLLEGGEKPYSPWEETLDGPEGARRVAYVWVHKGASSFNKYEAGAVELAAAESFCYPVSGYKTDLFAPYPRRSFGAGDTHAGEDCAWFREGCSYYAIADGVVRMVQGAGGDWGFLVVLEHLLPSGDYVTSLYGHAGWDVLVKPGELVKKGRKIASQGLSCAVENGGYGSHIHFGIGDGPFRRSKKHAKGESMTVAAGDKQVTGKILRLTYSKEKKGASGWPLVAAVVQLPDRSTVEAPLEEEPAQDQIAWMQAYIQKCEGWLNPETFLPEHVEGKKK